LYIGFYCDISINAYNVLWSNSPPLLFSQISHSSYFKQFLVGFIMVLYIYVCIFFECTYVFDLIYVPSPSPLPFPHLACYLPSKSPHFTITLLFFFFLGLDTAHGWKHICLSEHDFSCSIQWSLVLLFFLENCVILFLGYGW
jgi:hypothetical protein